jgi:hypothetical protein
MKLDTRRSAGIFLSAQAMPLAFALPNAALESRSGPPAPGSRPSLPGFRIFGCRFSDPVFQTVIFREKKYPHLQKYGHHLV